MRFDVITLFPELFAPFLVHGVTRRAFESGQVEVKLWQLRDFGDPPHARVDDRPYGGGPGMVLLVEPLLRALAAVRADRGDAVPVPVVNFSPAGRPLSQAVVGEFASGRGAILLCARLGSASPVSGNLYELDAIGAVVIGGTSLAGGRATIVGTFLGVLTFALIFSLMTQLNLSTEVQQVTKGAIVLGAVLLQRPEARL